MKKLCKGLNFYFRKNYKYVKRDRVYPNIVIESTEGPVSSSQDSADGG